METAWRPRKRPLLGEKKKKKKEKKKKEKKKRKKKKKKREKKKEFSFDPNDLVLFVWAIALRAVYK